VTCDTLKSHFFLTGWWREGLLRIISFLEPLGCVTAATEGHVVVTFIQSKEAKKL